MKKSLLLLACIVLMGCTEQEKRPVGYDGFKLDKAQNDVLVKHEALIFGVTTTKDEKETYQPGIIALFNALVERVAVLEAVDPNALEPRIAVLEERVDIIDRVLVGLPIEKPKEINEIIDRVNAK